MLKLAGQPNITVYYQLDKAIDFPVFIISNEIEHKFLVEVFNRYMNLSHYLLHRRLFIDEPYEGNDKYGQHIYKKETIAAIIEMTCLESIRFKAVTRLQLEKEEHYYYDGVRIEALPEEYYKYIDSRHSPSNLLAFKEHFKLDDKAYRYGHTFCYGDKRKT